MEESESPGFLPQEELSSSEAKRPTSLDIPSTLPTDLELPTEAIEDQEIPACSPLSSYPNDLLGSAKQSSSLEAPSPSEVENSSGDSKADSLSDARKLMQWSSSNLKRSNSAPLVNLIGRSPSPRGGHFVPKVLFSPGPVNRNLSATAYLKGAAELPRPSSSSETKPESSLRNHSTRYISSSHSSPIAFSPIRIPPKRIQNIRRESNVAGCILSDVERERLFRSSAQMSSSFETFGLDEGSMQEKRRSRAQSLTEPISILTHFLPSSGSPSPTRVDSQKQCYSPSTQQIVRNNIAFSPRPSPRSTPSPTRQKMIRSLSPIAILNRPNRKRKMGDGESEGLDSPKRFNGMTTTWCSAPRTPTYERSLPTFQPPGDMDAKASVLASSFESESNDSIGSSDCRASSTSSATGFAFPTINPKSLEGTPHPPPLIECTGPSLPSDPMEQDS